MNIIMETFGGWAPDAVKLMDRLARKHGSKLGADAQRAPWCARSFRSFHSMRISIALHRAAAEEILQTVQADMAASMSSES